MTDDNPVPLSSRYGISTQQTMWDMDARRHLAPTLMDGMPSDEQRCVCPGGKGVAGPCIRSYTQAGNYLCDACREHCWGVDPDGQHWRFVDSYGPTYTHVAPRQEPLPALAPRTATLTVAVSTLAWADNGKRVHCYERKDNARPTSLCRQSQAASWTTVTIAGPSDLPRCKNCERLASAREA